MNKKVFLLPILAFMALTSCGSSGGGESSSSEQPSSSVETRKGYLIDKPFTIKEAYDEAKKEGIDKYAYVYFQADVAESSAYGNEMILTNGDVKCYFSYSGAKPIDDSVKKDFTSGPNSLRGAKVIIKACAGSSVDDLTSVRKPYGATYAATGTVVKIDKTNLNAPTLDKADYTFFPYSDTEGEPADEATENANIGSYDLRSYAGDVYDITYTQLSDHTRYITKVVLTFIHNLGNYSDNIIAYCAGSSASSTLKYVEMDENWQVVFEFEPSQRISYFGFETSVDYPKLDKILYSKLYQASFSLTE